MRFPFYQLAVLCIAMKSVSFLMGADENPWVRVMSDHTTDKSIDQILEEEAIQRANQKAEREAEELR